MDFNFLKNLDKLAKWVHPLTSFVFLPILLICLIYFPIDYKVYIAVALLVDVALCLHFSFTFFQKKIQKWGFKKKILSELSAVNFGEKLILQRCVGANSRYIQLSHDSPDANSLCCKKILEKIESAAPPRYTTYEIPHFVWQKIVKISEFSRLRTH